MKTVGTNLMLRGDMATAGGHVQHGSGRRPPLSHRDPRSRRISSAGSASRSSQATGPRSNGGSPWTLAAKSIVLTGPGGKAAGHWRAITPGVTGSITVTSGTSDVQVRAVRGPICWFSQADSAGSIPVTRSTTKYQVSGSRWSPASSG